MKQTKKYDVFISHASEDKDSIVRPLVQALTQQGVRVWFDEDALQLGDSLSRSIDKGLSDSKFGLIILSSKFIAKAWPEYELKGLSAKELGESKVILPIWHNITREEVLKYSPVLAEKRAICTDQHSMDTMIVEIIKVIRPDIYKRVLKQKCPALSKRLQKDIERLHINDEIRQTIDVVLTHPEYPQWMSISGNLVKNPIWEAVADQSRQQLINKYRLDTVSAPQVMHLDLLLIRCNDNSGIGKIYTYFSSDWKTNLIPFRQWLPEDNPDQRQELNAVHLARHWPVPANTIIVTPITEKYLVSIKQHAKYRDLIIYIFEFCSVVFTHPPDSFLGVHSNIVKKKAAQDNFMDLKTLRNNKRASSVNGDVLRALHQLFSTTLGPLPSSLPDGFIKDGGD